MSRRTAHLGLVVRFAIELASVAALSFSSLYAEEPSVQYSVAAWGHKDGMPSTSIFSIAQSPDGFLWLGTDDGLVRFDGVQFTRWRPSVPSSPLPGQARVLHVTRDGELLLGTENGSVGWIRNGELKTTQLHAPVRSIQDGLDGSLWVATTSALWHLGAKSLQPVEPEIALPRGWVSGPLQSHDGREWITTYAGLFYIQAGRLVQSSETPARLLIAPGNEPAWLDEDGSLHSLENGRILEKSSALSSYFAAMTTAMRDSRGILWIGTRGEGVIRYSTTEGRANLRRYSRADGLSSDSIRSVFEDAEHNIWLGTVNGIERLRRNRATFLTMRDGLASDAVRSIAAGADGSVWLATADGLQRWSDGPSTVYLRGIPILSLLNSSSHGLWAGTAAGLMRIRGAHLTPSAKDEGFTAVTALAEDEHGVLWFYDASRGVFEQPDGRDPVPVKNTALLNHNVTAMAADSGGAVWFGLAGGGIVEERAGEFHTYSAHDGLSGGAIHGLSVGPEREIWAATETGLCLFVNAGFRCRHSHSGLPGDRVLWAVPDAHRNLWLGYNIGAARIEAQRLRQTTAEPGSAPDVKFFDDDDGIANNPDLTGNSPAAFSEDGRLWLTTTEGVAVLDPVHLRTNTLPPPVHILSLEADGRAVDITRPIRLPALTRSIHLLFTGLSFTAPRKMQFRYKLEPFDHEWRNAGTSREAFYTNLPPGRYTFRVRAANNDGVWNDTGDALSFLLRPAYFQTLWFRLLGVAAALLGMTLFFRLRLRSAQRMLRLRFEERMEERTRIAQELHDHLIQEMVGIGMQLEVVDELTSGSADAKTPLRRALQLLQKTIASGRLTLQALRQQPVTGAALLDSLRQTADAYPEKNRTEVEYRIEGQERLLRHEVAEDVMELGQEALRNALKYGGGSAIQIRLHYGTSTFELLVRDHGPGIEDRVLKEGVPGHFGLTGMLERASRLKGDFSIVSSPGRGTAVRILLTASRAYQDGNASDSRRDTVR